MQYYFLMLTIFFFLTISIGILTLSSLKSEGPNQAEIKITLNFMYSNFRALMGNVMTLLSLLTKDIIQTSIEESTSKEPQRFENLNQVSLEDINRTIGYSGNKNLLDIYLEI